MLAKSIKGKSFQEIQSALQQSLSDGFKPTLAFVFLSIKQERDAICAVLDKEGIAIFGATTGGAFIDGDIGSENFLLMLNLAGSRTERINFITRPVAGWH